MQVPHEGCGHGPSFLGIRARPGRSDTHSPTQEHIPGRGHDRRTPLATRLAQATLLLFFAQLTTGCRCSDDRPYTPFQVASSLPGGAPAPAPEPAPIASAPGMAASALVLRATGLPSEWEAFGRTLHAPKGTGFAGGVELPPHPSGSARVLAWALPKAPGSAGAAGLLLFDERGEARGVVAKVPAFLPSGSDCELGLAALTITLAGLNSSLETKCKSRLLPGTPTGAFVLTADPETKQAPIVLRRTDGPNADALQLWAESAPGGSPAGELTLHVDLIAPSGAHAELPLRFIEKAGGLSRIADAPAAELDALTKELLQLVAKKKERETALKRIDAARRWVTSICQEGGAPRLSDEGGRPFSCGSGAKTGLDRLTEAAIEAYLYRDEPWRAVGEYERAGDYLGAPAPATKAAWAKRIAQKSRFLPAAVAAEYPLRLGLDVPYPFASPLRYAGDGVLFGLTATGEVEPFASPPPAAESATTPASDTSISAWPLRPKSDDGRLLAALVPSCDRAEMVLTFQADGGEASPHTALPFLAPRPCRGLMGKPLPVEPIAWQGPALLAIAAGEPIRSQGDLLGPERPIAWGSSLGIHVWSKDQAVSWRGEGLQGLHHCVTPPVASASDVLSVACVRGRTAVEVRQIQPVPAGN